MMTHFTLGVFIDRRKGKHFLGKIKEKTPQRRAFFLVSLPCPAAFKKIAVPIFVIVPIVSEKCDSAG
jgi:predicted transporter